MRRLALFLGLLLWPAMAFAAFDAETLPDPRQEEMARAIMTEVRCLVCQGESIAESNADYAADLRRLVRERVAAGDSPEDVKAYLVSRYGDWVLLKPPVKPETYVLWAAPALFLGLGLLLVWRIFRRRSPKEGA
ncbi:cytochrome c-type biogenesis protein [Pedomonas sp. V897]|uniref:cytochrome c-type biogenesis protein n=1 Tax=Pedomonas sp. V897 TaxID=3446482 RepID=UPI003EE3DEF0